MCCQLLDRINSCVWGAGLTALLLFTGLLCFIKLRLYMPRKFAKIFRISLGGAFSKGGGEKLKTLCTALGATMGTGNIVGVCSAIAIGGSGAVFWMWVSGIFGMGTAFTENYLSAKFSKNGAVGASAYLKYGVKSEKLAKLFAASAIFASLGMGSMVQSNTLSEALHTGFDVPGIISGTACAVLVFCIICGGASRLKNASTAIVIPLSALYMALSLIVIAVFYKNIPMVMADVFKNAFNFRAMLGGFASSALGIGLRRGAFSNEAGLGSSPLFHSASSHSEKELGAFAAFEVFVDTVICCTLTALSVLCADKELDVSSAFSAVFENSGKYIVLISLSLFALATILGWSLAAEKSAVFLFGEKAVFPIRLLFSLAVFAGAVYRADTVWVLSDIFNGFMAYPNLFGLLLLYKTIEPLD